MSTFSYVKGVLPKDEKYEKMLSIYNACEEMDITPPKEVSKYLDLDNNEICESGIMKDLPPSAYKECYDMTGCNVIEVDLSKIPKDYKRIRFIISY